MGMSKVKNNLRASSRWRASRGDVAAGKEGTPKPHKAAGWAGAILPHRLHARTHRHMGYYLIWKRWPFSETETTCGPAGAMGAMIGPGGKMEWMAREEQWGGGMERRVRETDRGGMGEYERLTE